MSEQAREKIEAMGFVVSEVKQAKASEPVDSVINQEPAPGTLLTEGRKIVITVSTGK